MNDVLEAAREAQAAITEKVAHGPLRVAATKRGPVSDMPASREDILKLADILSKMLDLHDEIDARLARLEQRAMRRRR